MRPRRHRLGNPTPHRRLPLDQCHHPARRHPAIRRHRPRPLTSYSYQVRALYAAAPPSAWSSLVTASTANDDPNNLIAHWRFDETTGTIATDSSGYGHHATFSGAPAWTSGQVGNAISLTDTANRGQVADAPAFNALQKLTIAGWVRPTNLDGGNNARFIISKRTTTTEGVFSLLFHTGNRLFVDLATNNDRFSSDTIFENNVWYHLAVVYDGTLPAAERVRL
jgi:hypothetical protein